MCNIITSSALSDQYETLTGYRQYTSNSQGIHHVSYNQVQDDVAVFVKGTPYITVPLHALIISVTILY